MVLGVLLPELDETTRKTVEGKEVKDASNYHPC